MTRRIEWIPRYALNAPTLTEALVGALALAGMRVMWHRGRPWAWEQMDLGPAL